MKLLTTAESAGLLGVTPRQAQRLIAKGLLKGVKMGRDWFVEPREIERFQKRRRGKGRPRKREK
jgi:excisionase family DNA binding protein